MLTREELIELFSNANRKLFLGEDIYEKCVRNSNKISRDDLQKRLDFWKSNYDLSHIFKNCNVDDVARICNFSPDKPVNDILDNKCYNDVKNNINLGSLAEANVCSICYEYTKGQNELPNRIGCGHYFHYSCLNEWVGRGNEGCPICRQPINMLLGFPVKSNEELFKAIQKMDKDFTTRYLKEMKLFMTPDEIKAFKAIHGIELEEGNVKDLLLSFLINLFLWNLIAKGSAYISTTIDPNYTPYIERELTEGNMILETSITENIILLPSSLYFGLQIIFLTLTVFGNILKTLSR